jgi:hypothetical protein
MKTIVITLNTGKEKHPLDDGTFDYMRQKFPHIFKEEVDGVGPDWKTQSLKMLPKLFTYDRVIFDDTIPQGFIWELAAQTGAYHQMHDTVDTYRIDFLFSREELVTYTSQKYKIYDVEYVNKDGFGIENSRVYEHSADEVRLSIALSGIRKINSIKEVLEEDSGISK